MPCECETRAEFIIFRYMFSKTMELFLNSTIDLSGAYDQRCKHIDCRDDLTLLLASDLST